MIGLVDCRDVAVGSRAVILAKSNPRQRFLDRPEPVASAETRTSNASAEAQTRCVSLQVRFWRHPRLKRFCCGFAGLAQSGPQ